MIVIVNNIFLTMKCIFITEPTCVIMIRDVTASFGLDNLTLSFTYGGQILQIMRSTYKSNQNRLQTFPSLLT